VAKCRLSETVRRGKGFLVVTSDIFCPAEQLVASEEGYAPWNSLMGILCEPELGSCSAGVWVQKNAKKKR
jgi:hypothetical protein